MSLRELETAYAAFARSPQDEDARRGLQRELFRYGQSSHMCTRPAHVQGALVLTARLHMDSRAHIDEAMALARDPEASAGSAYKRSPPERLLRAKRTFELHFASARHFHNEAHNELIDALQCESTSVRRLRKCINRLRDSELRNDLLILCEPRRKVPVTRALEFMCAHCARPVMRVLEDARLDEVKVERILHVLCTLLPHVSSVDELVGRVTRSCPAPL